jgi:hypothetical protein
MNSPRCARPDCGGMPRSASRRHVSCDGRSRPRVGVYSDPAIVIAWLLRQGIAYVDIPAHHDGCRPRSITIGGWSRSACTGTRRRCFPTLACPSIPAGPAPRDQRSMSRCRPGSAMPAGCAPFHPIILAAAAAAPAAGTCQRARLRHAPAGSAGPPGVERRRVARGPRRRPYPRATVTSRRQRGALIGCGGRNRRFRARDLWALPGG